MEEVTESCILTVLPEEGEEEELMLTLLPPELTEDAEAQSEALQG